MSNSAPRSIDQRTLVYFDDNPRHIISAYVESGEGIDRAGGFAIQVRLPLLPCSSNQRCFQGLGGLLVRKIEGDYNNVVGFPAASFLKFLELLVEEEEDFLDI